MKVWRYWLLLSRFAVSVALCCCSNPSKLELITGAGTPVAWLSSSDRDACSGSASREPIAVATAPRWLARIICAGSASGFIGSFAIGGRFALRRVKLQQLHPSVGPVDLGIG